MQTKLGSLNQSPWKLETTGYSKFFFLILGNGPILFKKKCYKAIEGLMSIITSHWDSTEEARNMWENSSWNKRSHVMFPTCKTLLKTWDCAYSITSTLRIAFCRFASEKTARNVGEDMKKNSLGDYQRSMKATRTSRATTQKEEWKLGWRLWNKLSCRAFANSSLGQGWPWVAKKGQLGRRKL